MANRKTVPGIAFMALAILAGLSACSSLPGIATDVSYCCEAGAESIYTYRIEFVDVPEFLKPMLRDSAATVLAAKGLEYTEGDAHAILQMTYVDKTLEEESNYDLEAWEKVAPGGGVRFIAEVLLEIRDAVSGERIWSGSMQRIHNVYEGSYMHDEPAKAAMRQAFAEIFAGYPDQTETMR